MSAVKVAAAAAMVAVGICAHTTSSLRLLQASEFRRAFSLAAGMMAVITGNPATVTAPSGTILSK